LPTIVAAVGYPEIPKGFMGTIDFATLVQSLDSLAGQRVTATLVLQGEGGAQKGPHDDTSVQVEGTLCRRRLPDDAQQCFSVGESARLNLDEADFDDAELFTNSGHDDFAIFVHLSAATLFLWGDLPSSTATPTASHDA
jgi:hypothetical protein